MVADGTKTEVDKTKRGEKNQESEQEPRWLINKISHFIGPKWKKIGFLLFFSIFKKIQRVWSNELERKTHKKNQKK